MSKPYRELELLVAKIQRQLAPKAEILHNVKLDGRLSKQKRQIDVLVRDRIGQYEINIVIDCKDYADPVDVKGVEEFDGLLRDVGAQKGVLVCPKGFTSTAKVRAEGLQIDLYSPVDTSLLKWQVRATIPALCDFRNAMVAFGLRMSAPYPFELPYDFHVSRVVFDEHEQALGTSLEMARQKWNGGQLPRDVGTIEDITLFEGSTTLMDSGYGQKVPVNIGISLYIERELYFGHLPVPHISGFRDELSGKVITNAFTVGLLDPIQISREWVKLSHESDAPVRPVMTLQGLVAWTQDGETI
jgi:hypothetical protein